MTTNREQEQTLLSTVSNSSSDIRALISLVEFELGRADKAASRPGWNSWALWGAIGAVAWLVLGELEGSSIVWGTVASWFLLASLFTDLTFMVSALLNHGSTKQDHGHRFVIANQSLGSVRSFLVLFLFRYCILTIIGIHLFATFPSWAAYPLVSYTILAALLFASFLALSFARFPLPSTQVSSWPRNVVFTILVLLLIIGAAGSLITSAQNLSPPILLKEVRVGGLFWTISILIILVSMTRPRSPIIEALVDIRRDLALNPIDVSTAKRQIEIAVHGLRVGDILQQEVSAVLTPLRVALNAEEQISREIEALLAQIPSDPTATLTNEQQNLVSAVIRSVDSLQKDVDGNLKIAEQASSSFAKKARPILEANPLTRPEIELLRGDIDSMLNTLKDRTRTAGVSIQQLGMRIRKSQ